MTGRPCQCALAVFHKNVSNPTQNVEDAIKKDAAALQRPFGWLRYSGSDLKVGIVLQHVDVGHKGALLGVGERGVLHILVQHSCGAHRVWPTARSC